MAKKNRKSKFDKDLDEIKTKVGKRIQYFRTQQNLTQEELAVVIWGVNGTGSRISDFERGDYSMGLSSLLKIAQGLDIEISDLFDFKDNKVDSIRKTTVIRRVDPIGDKIDSLLKEVNRVKNDYSKFRKSLDK